MIVELRKLQKEVEEMVRAHDSAHNFQHIMRVFNNAKRISEKEKVNTKIVLYAALLHDIVSYPKSDKRSKKSSTESSIKARKILKNYPLSADRKKIICNSIRDHSFSKNKVPDTLEGKILQDADRLDALGAIGIARTFAVGGFLNRELYNPLDAFCKRRKPKDQFWTLDHFIQKLLLLQGKMNTSAGEKEAIRRTKVIKIFLKNLEREIYP